MEQPYSHKFHADTLHSGSVSFGRFQGELYAWEHRSSFSHNRYLEEVQRFSKPGSVIEKKAYFEAHFKKKALLRQSSSASNSGTESQSGEDNESMKEDDKREISFSGSFDCDDERRLESRTVLPKPEDVIDQEHGMPQSGYGDGIESATKIDTGCKNTDGQDVVSGEAHGDDGRYCVTDHCKHSDVETCTVIDTECEEDTKGEEAFSPGLFDNEISSLFEDQKSVFTEDKSALKTVHAECDRSLTPDVILDTSDTTQRPDSDVVYEVPQIRIKTETEYERNIELDPAVIDVIPDILEITYKLDNVIGHEVNRIEDQTASECEQDPAVVDVIQDVPEITYKLDNVIGHEFKRIEDQTESECEQHIEVKRTVIEAVHQAVPCDKDLMKNDQESKICDSHLDKDFLPSKPMSEIRVQKSNLKPQEIVRETERSTLARGPVNNTRKKVVGPSKTKIPKQSPQDNISAASSLCKTSKAEANVLRHGRQNNNLKPSKSETMRSVAMFTFRSDKRAEKRKEFYSRMDQKLHEKQVAMQHIEAKHKEKADAEMKQYRRSLNFKANPMPSFYHEARQNLGVKQDAAESTSFVVCSILPVTGGKSGKPERLIAPSARPLIPNDGKPFPRPSTGSKSGKPERSMASSAVPLAPNNEKPGPRPSTGSRKPDRPVSSSAISLILNNRKPGTRPSTRPAPPPKTDLKNGVRCEDNIGRVRRIRS